MTQCSVDAASSCLSWDADVAWHMGASATRASPSGSVCMGLGVQHAPGFLMSYRSSCAPAGHWAHIRGTSNHQQHILPQYWEGTMRTNDGQAIGVPAARSSVNGCTPHSHTSLACLSHSDSFLVASTTFVCIGGNVLPPRLICLGSPTCEPTDMAPEAANLILMISSQ